MKHYRLNRMDSLRLLGNDRRITRISHSAAREARMDLGLHGLRALVTGGTRGIGRAIVEVLAAEGAVVCFCARTERDVTDTVDTLTGRGSQVSGQVLDVADQEGMRRWVAGSAAELGGLDIVVANVSALAIPLEQANRQVQYDVDMMAKDGKIQAALPYIEQS